jgi:four helix bundle protein
MTIQKFEDLICWQKARELANFIFDITDRKEFKDYDLKRQIRRAAISPMSNIAEGFDRGTRQEFVDALFIGKGEAGEVRSQLYISYDRKYISAVDFQRGLGLTDETSRLIQSFVYKLKGGARRGLQFKHVPGPNDFDTKGEYLRKNAPEVYEKIYGKKA